ncbi:MAG: response regulator, partial [Pseudomonadota bacterium]
MSPSRKSVGRPILLVDDDRHATEFLSTYLASEGFCTIVAHDGRAALELAARYRLLFAILDVTLPDMEGWEICRRLRKFSSVPILMVSGRGTLQDRVKGLTLGADDYLVKPVELRELGARVKAILRRASLPQSPAHSVS